MKNINRILFVVSFIAIIVLLIAFTSIRTFKQISYVWQCGLYGFFGLLWIACLLIELWKKEIK